MTEIFTDKNFKTEVLESKIPVLVDFYADWCGPCRIQAKIIDELAKELKEKVRIGKLNVDQNPKISQKYNIMSIPTLIIFRNSKKIQEMIGLQTKETLKQKLEKL